MSTIKRYWSTLTPLALERMTKEEIIEAKRFDAKLTPDDVTEMQTIDADCNDCRHFKRGKMEKSSGLTMFHGTCGIDGRDVRAWPMQFSGHSCFEHRRKVNS